MMKLQQAGPPCRAKARDTRSDDQTPRNHTLTVHPKQQQQRREQQLQMALPGSKAMGT